ncbi:hypothetical protein [Tahibacter amnicola]|uniref:Thioredoxin domain-containing protein n=1 Tax=Tahibacter amnicola TaxID=2976241 RepID=A0ABY6BFE0_9GAMM|nr:hypothetical protein [Tahibacter amnicola]UXI68535.1 hypothetical protein N4264_02450 [Tahibacter amnicola]
MMLATAFAALAQLATPTLQVLDEVAARHLVAPGARTKVIALWSLDCGYCDAHLRALDTLARNGAPLDVAIVATDGAERSEAAAAHLAALQLGSSSTWIYAEAASPRIGYRLDPEWGGELPRTIVIDPDARRSRSGVLSEVQWKQLLGVSPE